MSHGAAHLLKCVGSSRYSHWGKAVLIELILSYGCRYVGVKVAAYIKRKQWICDPNLCQLLGADLPTLLLYAAGQRLTAPTTTGFTSLLQWQTTNTRLRLLWGCLQTRIQCFTPKTAAKLVCGGCTAVVAAAALFAGAVETDLLVKVEPCSFQQITDIMYWNPFDRYERLNVCLFGPVVEEVEYRQLMFMSLLASGCPGWLSAVTSSMCWAAAHKRWSRLPELLISGVSKCATTWLFPGISGLALTSCWHIYHNTNVTKHNVASLPPVPARGIFSRPVYLVHLSLRVQGCVEDLPLRVTIEPNSVMLHHIDECSVGRICSIRQRFFDPYIAQAVAVLNMQLALHGANEDYCPQFNWVKIPNLEQWCERYFLHWLSSGGTPNLKPGTLNLHADQPMLLAYPMSSRVLTAVYHLPHIERAYGHSWEECSQYYTFWQYADSLKAAMHASLEHWLPSLNFHQLSLREFKWVVLVLATADRAGTEHMISRTSLVHPYRA